MYHDSDFVPVSYRSHDRSFDGIDCPIVKIFSQIYLQLAKVYAMAQIKSGNWWRKTFDRSNYM